MNKDLNSLILSLLLHDIGKFFQRTASFFEDHSQLSSFFINIISGRTDSLKQIKIKNYEEIVDFDLVAKLIKYHHDQDISTEDERFKKLWSLLKKADNLASKKERVIQNNNLTPDSSLVNQNDIFDFLGKMQNEINPLNIHKISAVYDFKKDSFFPVRREKILSYENIHQYKSLLGKDNFGFFIKNLLDDGNESEMTFISFLYALDDILHFFLTTIPEDRRDIYQLNSLYDHSKLVTVYGQCFYFHEQKAYLLKYDIAGIQKFIFDIKMKKAAKMLRGRSFFIQLLNEIINYLFVRRLYLIPQNILSSFGGNTLMILPFKDNIEEEINGFFQAVNQFLLTKFNLYLRYDIKEVDIKDDFFNLKKYYLEPKLDKKIVFNLENINNLVVKNNTQDYRQCDICNTFDKATKRDEDLYLCPSCDFIYQISLNLQKNSFYGIDIHKLNEVIFGNAHDSINNLIIKTDTKNKDDDNFFIKSYVDFNGKLNIKEKFFFSSPSKTIFYKITQPKHESGEFLSFEEIVENRDGAPLLLYLKLDVDNMSKIFETCFNFRDESEKYTKITDRLHFSRRINLFFQNYVSLFIEKNYPKDIYLVYSGGDDLFLTGYWEKVFDFVFDLYEEFRQFVLENPKLHFSAGAVLAKADYPVYFISEKIEQKLDQAKKAQKNKFAFLYSIESFDIFKRIYKDGLSLGMTETISTSFIYKIFSLSDYVKNQKNHYLQAVNFYKMIYFFKRNLKKITNPENEIEKMHQERHNQIFDMFDKFFNGFMSRRFDDEFNYFKNNLKTITSLALLKRRKNKGI
ncbi:MAG: type III-A CRISPR-associated protein Cas10/Csm1 [Microgenomates group bacterium]